LRQQDMPDGLYEFALPGDFVFRAQCLNSK